MDSKKMLQQSGFGRLPATAPLANPYVPFQMEDPPRYEPRMGVIRGTLFPGLDLPFMNMVNQKELPMTPLAELQTMGFALHELALYLDTHQDDKEAFEVFRTFQRLYAQGREKYEKECGPLTHMSAMNDKYTWLKDPWPWEYAGNREV
ncbi:MAG: spore coat protein CotJB [Oscillospiraceae bacterium]|nr:spore coat protein CotJB [Oscillospiraceae bacterium]